jgi:hypothetical protein
VNSLYRSSRVLNVVVVVPQSVAIDSALVVSLLHALETAENGCDLIQQANRGNIVAFAGLEAAVASSKVLD